MAALAEQQTYRYPYPSHVDTAARSTSLRLATFTNETTSSPFFFEGQLVHPRRTADLLRGLMDVVRSRFHIPAAMLQRILAEADPIVTSNDDRLRFEGFSACCGAYVRIDLLADSLDGKITGRGTTNVDFNQPMLNALAKIRSNDEVSIAVGSDQVVLKKQKLEVVEKKVKLPVRWLKGLVEVQAVQARMELVHEIDGMQAFRFLRSLPRMKTHRRATYVIKAGKGLRLSQVESRDAVVVGGLERLRVLESLAKDAERLKVYSDSLTGASAWILEFEDCRFQQVISPEVWRGFSGEGQALESIAKKQEKALPKVRALLKWQSVVDEAKLSKSTRFSKATVDAALKLLGARGLVGYDLAENAYFHRELPFDLSQVEKLQPRLKSARKLLAEDNVRVGKKTKTTIEFLVKSSDVEHRVKLQGGNAESWKCTCPWFAKHENTRGPCKHILASQILLDESDSG